MKVPTITFSFDFEIGWGDITNDRWINREKRGTYTHLRKVLPRLLDVMEELDIPASWATVGAMVESPSKRNFEHLPEKALQVVKTSLSNGAENSFYGRDLFEMVLGKQNTGHKIANHSFSHVPFTYPGMSDEVVKTEMMQFHSAFDEFNIDYPVNRFVFPENIEAFHSTLFTCGIRKVRASAIRTTSSRTSYLVNSLFSAPPQSVIRQQESGLSVETGSMLFNMGVNKAYRMPFVARRARMGLAALNQNRIDRLHIWSHPFNFAESDLLLDSFVSFLGKVANERDKGIIKIEVM